MIKLNFLYMFPFGMHWNMPYNVINTYDKIRSNICEILVIPVRIFQIFHQFIGNMTKEI